MTYQGVNARFDAVTPLWAMSDVDPMGNWFAHYGAGRPSLAPPDVIQFVWADRRGRFPDDPYCDPVVVAAQPCGVTLATSWWADGPDDPTLLTEAKRLRSRVRFR